MPKQDEELTVLDLANRQKSLSYTKGQPMRFTSAVVAARKKIFAVTAKVKVQMFLVATLLCFACSGIVNSARAELFAPQTFTLNNGMQVVVLTNRRAPIVTHMVWYKVGAVDDPWGTSGIAHFLEHLMFRGSVNVPPGMFSRRVAENGGSGNAFTSWDYTAYHQTIARDRLDLVMSMEADRMKNLQLNRAQLLPERDVILEERRSRIDNSPSAKLSEQMYRALFTNSPYGRPIIGWEHEMRQLDLKDAQAFYNKWYAPNNAILIVAGDIDAKELRPLAEKYYGGIPKRVVPGRIRTAEPESSANVQRRIIMRSAEVRQSTMRRMYLAPSVSTGSPSDICAIQILAEILGGGSTSRLHRKLVVEQAIAVSASAYYDPNSLGQAVLNFSITPRGESEIRQRLAAIEGVLNDEIEKLVEDGVTEEEVRQVRERMVASTAFARDDLESAARVIGASLSTGETIDDVESWPQRIGAVTAEQVNKMARLIFSNQSAVTGQLLPVQETKP